MAPCLRAPRAGCPAPHGPRRHRILRRRPALSFAGMHVQRGADASPLAGSGMRTCGDGLSGSPLSLRPVSVVNVVGGPDPAVELLLADSMAIANPSVAVMSSSMPAIACRGSRRGPWDSFCSHVPQNKR
jgi:hypothetical protein